LGDDIHGRFHTLEREQKIDALLQEIKAKKTPERLENFHR